MIFETANSIYEVHEGEHRFRRIHDSSRDHQPLPLGRWYRYQRMSPVVVGEPVRFLWLLDEQGTQSRIGLWATGPVTSVLPDEDPAFLLSADTKDAASVH
ncbi:MAG: hypothetical protein ACRDZ8_10175 [Acidimicrobiales bacterium]